MQEDQVLLCMGDHIIDGKPVKCLLDRQGINETLCIDFTPAQHHQLAEATKVTVDIAGCIMDIGKDLVYWDAQDTGIFLLTENFFRALEQLVYYLGNNTEISDVIRFLISQGYSFDTCNVSDYFWADVDTSEDLDLVRV